MLVLLLVALWFVLRSDLLCVFPCVILFLCFSVLLVLRLPRLGKRELVLVLFKRLSGLCLFCRFSLPHGVWEGLRFVIVALPGLFSYLFWCCCCSLLLCGLFCGAIVLCPEVYGDLVYRFGEVVGESDFSERFGGTYWPLWGGEGGGWLWPGCCAAGWVPGCRPGHCWWLCFALCLRGGGSGLGLGDGLFLGHWPVCWGLAVCLWLGPPWFSFAMACGGVGRECSSLFIVVIGLIFVFSLWSVDWVGGLWAGRVLVCFCVESGVGARGGVGWL